MLCYVAPPLVSPQPPSCFSVLCYVLLYHQKFLSQKLEAQVKSEFDKMTDKIDPNSYGQYAGSCPNHPELYKNLDCFDLNQTYNVLKLIDEIYECCDRKYYTKS